jgi:hypothetical protein
MRIERLKKSEAELDRLNKLHPRDEYHEDHGNVLWWTLPIVEPPYVGTTLDDDFPDYVTHWSVLSNDVGDKDQF